MFISITVTRMHTHTHTLHKVVGLSSVLNGRGVHTAVRNTDVVQGKCDYTDGAVKCVALARCIASAVRCVSSAVRSAPHESLWSGLFSWTGHQQVSVCVLIIFLW